MRKVVFALAIVGWFFVPLGIAIGRQGLSAIGKHRHDFASVSYVIQVHYEVKQRRFQMFGGDLGRFVSTDSDQTETAPRKFKLGPLGSLNQVTKGLAKTIRAMADGTLDSQVGARICNGLGIMRACLETQKLEQLEARMDEIAHRVARDRTNAVRERTSTDEAQRFSN